MSRIVSPQRTIRIEVALARRQWPCLTTWQVWGSHENVFVLRTSMNGDSWAFQPADDPPRMLCYPRLVDPSCRARWLLWSARLLPNGNGFHVPPLARREADGNTRAGRKFCHAGEVERKLKQWELKKSQSRHVGARTRLIKITALHLEGFAVSSSIFNVTLWTLIDG
jgi:hypothetical protein